MPNPPESNSARANAASDLLLTVELLRRAKQGDRPSLEALSARYLPRLQRWASGRLPNYARSLFDTSDLVQETLLKALEGLDGIEVRGPGGFQAYVRQAVLNRIRDQIRWARRRPGPEGVPEDLTDRAPSPLEHAIGADVLERYESALARLSEDEQRLLHLRIELDFDYEEIAGMTERPSRDAARMAVQRALRRLAEAMSHES
ncbi:MAG: RNA polymerase sigma factor [Candidatus Eisenbacteria bacterium]|uniref:RNA polymerase sigma factor n=1 Tax=Eiseniibacteriota bacterium TaxID=2212470 RepID=A0A849SEV7_UNCEI|nr:RNA polymerase sigma factor [Candidatus Eisenbacteria bacterium]